MYSGVMHVCVQVKLLLVEVGYINQSMHAMWGF